MNKTIYVTMFQTFTMKYGDSIVSSEEIKSKKLIKLLTYLLYYYDRRVPSTELIDLIWYYEEIDNPIGALKNLVYRLRTVIKHELGIDDFIITGKSSYCINNEYKIEVDTHKFEQCNKKLTDDPQNEDLYKQMMELYNGDFLGELDEDHRNLSRSAYFHSLYISRVIEYCTFLESQERFEEVEKISRQALNIDKLDEELYILLIQSLYYQGYYHQASEAYKETVDYLYRSLGTNPSDEFKELFELIKKEEHSQSTNIHDIQKGLKIEEKFGAYLCEYGAFRDLYNLQARMMDRLGVCNHLCVVTINDRSRYEIDKEKNHIYVEKTMQKIQASLVAGMRVGDVVSRFSTNQFVVLLPVCNFENATMVMNRTLKKIIKDLNNKNIAIDISITEVSSEELEGA